MSKIGDRFKSAIPLEALHGKVILQAPRIAAFALALAILGQAAVIVARFVHIRATAQRILAPVGSPRAPAIGRRGLNVVAITRAHLFGAPPRALANRGNAAETRLPLVLSGTLAARDPKSGLAILGPTTTATQLYAVGQGLPGGARLHAVYTAWVLIDRDGMIETLRLPQSTASGITRGSAPAPPPEPAVADDTSDEPPTIIGGVIRPRAVRGRQGFLLAPGDNAAVFAALGLEPGDFVTAVDGQPLEGEIGGGRILGTLNTASTARLTIVRDGVEHEVNLNLAQAAAQLNDQSEQ